MSSGSPRQLVLDIAPRPAYGSEDFLVAPSNQLAFTFVENWPKWPSSLSLLIGPEGTGKTHLLEIWRRRAGAQLVDISVLNENLVPTLMPPGAAVALKHTVGTKINQKALFHLLNAAKENNGYVLVASRSLPKTWDLTLPDLVSRLAAAPAIHVQPAEEELLRGVLVKLFADRQCAVDEGFIQYLITRMPRSLAAARSLVMAIDERSLATGAAPSRQIAAQVLAELAGGDATREEGV